MANLLSQKNESVFERVFADMGNADIITAFLRDVLDIPVGETAEKMKLFKKSC